MLIQRLNKKLIYLPKEEKVVESTVNSTVNNKLLCPKCYHTYDGEVCFVCGFTRHQNKA